MIRRLDDFFKFTAKGSNFRTEIIAGLTTFAAMAYIICLQPALLSGSLPDMVATGMPKEALITTTCLVSAFGCILMGLWANYPVGMAPGMGSNFVFVRTIIPACGAALGVAAGDPAAWQAALGVILLGGVIFLLISLTRIRNAIINLVSDSQKNAIAVGLGLFIGSLGLRSGHIIKIKGNELSMTTSISDPAVIVFGVGLLVTTILMLRRAKGALLIGIAASVLTAIFYGQIEFKGIVDVPANPLPVMFKMDVVSVFKYSVQLLPLVLICSFIGLFDTMGTIFGIGVRPGLVHSGRIERDQEVFTSGAIATVGGAVGGHNIVVTYVESASGIEVGGRTGLTAVVVGLCFLLSLIFYPIISAVASYGPATAATLVVVGALMLRCAGGIHWNDISEAVPAFLIIVAMPLSGSVAGGIALGLCVYPFIKFCGGEGRNIRFASYILGILLLLYLLFLHI